MSRARTERAERDAARLRDLRDLYNHLLRRNRKTAAAIVTIAERADTSTIAAMATLIAFVAKHHRDGGAR